MTTRLTTPWIDDLIKKRIQSLQIRGEEREGIS